MNLSDKEAQLLSEIKFTLKMYSSANLWKLHHKLRWPISEVLEIAHQLENKNLIRIENELEICLVKKFKMVKLPYEPTDKEIVRSLLKARGKERF